MTMGIDRSIGLAANGMACDHCMKSVTEELEEVRGTTNVEVILNSGAISKVTVFTSKGMGDDALREAIIEADFGFVSISRDSWVDLSGPSASVPQSAYPHRLLPWRPVHFPIPRRCLALHIPHAQVPIIPMSYSLLRLSLVPWPRVL